MRHPIDVLPIALFLVLGACQVLGFGHPTDEFGGYLGVIAGWFEQDLEAVDGEGNESL